MNKVKLDNIIFGDSAIPFIGGPCVIESRDHCFGIAEKITEITSKLNIPFVFKSSFEYNENEILKIAEEYIAKTYTLHYTGKKGTQTLDLIESIGDAEAFCRSNAIKYLSRFGKKDGKSKSDLLKAIHYCTLLYHFSGLTNESIDSNETI